MARFIQVGLLTVLIALAGAVLAPPRAVAATGVQYGLTDDAWLLDGPGTLESRLGDVLQRVARRERNDVLRAAKRLLGKNDVDGFKAWSLDFFAEHRTFVEQQLEPVINAAHQLKVTNASPAELAGQIASRGLGRVTGWIQASATADEVFPQLEAGYQSVEADELEYNQLPALPAA